MTSHSEELEITLHLTRREAQLIKSLVGVSKLKWTNEDAKSDASAIWSALSGYALGTLGNIGYPDVQQSFTVGKF